MRRVLCRPEQLFAVSFGPDGTLYLGGDRHERMPWSRLGKCHLYALTVADLELLLEDATSLDYMILDGAESERRGLRGFSVGIGAWGCRGTVECRTIDSWCFEAETKDPVLETGRLQTLLRGLCKRLNGEEIVFRTTSLKYVQALYRKLATEPEDNPPLSADIALFCRKAHVGGPIVHCRTSLAPFVHLDRDRAYGQAMLEDIPSGKATEIQLTGNGLKRWRPRDLMALMGVADATIDVKPGTFLPLMPLMRWHELTSRTKTLYPTGQFRSTFCLHELALMEERGRGDVKALHRVVTFEPIPVLAPIIRYLRKVEPDLPIKTKRLEHMLYGICARSLEVKKFGTGYDYGSPMVGDIVDTALYRKLGRGTKIHPFRKSIEGRHRLFKIVGRVSPQGQFGSMDRPDRSAWITASNRMAMDTALDVLDKVFKPRRPRDYVGRIYVDGMDIEARVEDVPELYGMSKKGHGPKISIYRAGTIFAHNPDGTTLIEATGIDDLPEKVTEEDLKKILAKSLNMAEHGPFAGGRYWADSPDGEVDPRLTDNQQSEPLHIDEETSRRLGFGDEPDSPGEKIT